MRFPIALRIATTMLFAAGASVASAQLSARSANGGLFNSLVDWNPVANQSPLGVGDVRMSPWAASQVQLGTVRPADPNRPWMGYWGQTQHRELGDIVGAERAMRANPIAYASIPSRGVPSFVLDVALLNVPTGGSTSANNDAANNDLNEQDGSQDAQTPAGFGPQVSLAVTVVPDVIVNPEPETYWLAAAGLVVIALIRRYRVA